MMVNLLRILNMLRTNPSTHDYCYYIPEAWNRCGYKDFKQTPDRPGEILVNPYSYMAHCIEYLLLSAESGENGRRESVPLTGNIIYGILPRMFAAWRHGKDDRLDSGTFLKVVCLIPYLRELNVGIIYLLPIFKYSSKYTKGSMGSPYAIKNIYMLDENLHDGLLGKYTEELLDIEFKAFVEACHISGIKVMVDFVFRTVARDNDLLLTRPEWFYWIDAKVKDSFCIPYVESEKEHTLLSDKSLVSIYSCAGIRDYLASFSPSPASLNPEKWNKTAGKCKKNNGNILEYIEKHFGISTVPGFSDVINDIQPPWSDATYLRYYFDVHEKAKKYVSPQQAPYILQDGVKLNLYRGREKNKELWEYIAGVIPHYQKHYGIDGARIDMGHALPPELNREIISRAKQQNPDFILWSEEFNVKNSGHAKKDGFHFITSMVWHLYKDTGKPGFNKKLFKTLMGSEIPLTGAMETPDTPRSACTHNNRKLLNLLVWLTCFIPNAVPFINNGQELMEIQPMNLGLDNTEEGRFVLPKDDPMYGRLAFFDSYCLHWLSPDREWMTNLLIQATDLRKQMSALMSAGKNFFCQPEKTFRRSFILFGYSDAVSGGNVFLLANKSMKRKNTANLAELLPDSLSGRSAGYGLIHGRMPKGELFSLDEGLELLPGEVVIGRLYNYKEDLE